MLPPTYNKRFQFVGVVVKEKKRNDGLGRKNEASIFVSLLIRSLILGIVVRPLSSSFYALLCERHWITVTSYAVVVYGAELSVSNH